MFNQKNGHQQLKYTDFEILRTGIQENPRFFTPGSWRTSWQLSKVVIQLQRCMQRNGMAIQLWRRPTLVRVNWLLEPNYDVINAAPF
jgi:hypothetical protein